MLQFCKAILCNSILRQTISWDLQNFVTTFLLQNLVLVGGRKPIVHVV
jgi:hypothetical protein